MIYHINKIKDKNHMNISIDAKIKRIIEKLAILLNLSGTDSTESKACTSREGFQAPL